ncbi:MAG: CASTOR/POLLUX-related putative ion channel [Woeseiaceae bacterium]
MGNYHVAFNGEIADGHSMEDVKARFAAQLKTDDAGIDRLFSGNTFKLTKGLEWEQALSAADQLRVIGAMVFLVDDEGRMVDTPSSANEEFIEPCDLTATAKVRHLTQLTSTQAVAEKPAADGRKAQMRYRFDSFMAKGGSSIFKVLTAVFLGTFLIIGLLRGALLLLYPDLAAQHDELGFLGNLYITFLEITDPGNMAQDIYSNVAYKVFAVLAGIAGIVMLSALIAFITTSLDQKIYELKRGRSKVIEEGHTLILGWNEQRIVEIVRELKIANESEKDACVVILADYDKEEMDDVLRLRLGETANTRIVTRSGDVSSLNNLDMVSLEEASSVVILASCDDTDSVERKAASDAKAIQTVLATMGGDADNDEFSVIVEIFNPTHRDIVRSSFPDHVITIDTRDILAKLLVQTSRSVGLSVVYNEILSFDGCELYFYESDWGERTFGEIGYHFPDGVPMGIRDGTGDILLKPESHRLMADGDEILILADDDSTIEFKDEQVAKPFEMKLPDRRLEQRRERELMIGWSFKSAAIIREFADYIIAGSEVSVLLKNPTAGQKADIAALDAELDSISVSLLVKDCLNIDELMSVKPFEYDNIVILAGSDGDDGAIDAGRIDSENIVALLLLRRIFSQYPEESGNTKLITEILDSQNDALVAKAGVQDVIISNRLVSMIMAQVSESRDIEKVYDDIFQEDGSEIYLKPVSLYYEALPIEVSFADMMAMAQSRREICIGVKTKALESSRLDNNGITLIPEKSTRFNLNPEDSLVVLAEDEL